MNITLCLPPEVEAKLAEQAARLHMPREAVALQAIKETLVGESTVGRLSHEQWHREFDAWLTSHQPVFHFVDGSRESIYGDDGR